MYVDFHYKNDIVIFRRTPGLFDAYAILAHCIAETYSWLFQFQYHLLQDV